MIDKLYFKNYYLNNREKILSRTKVNYNLNKENIMDYHKKYFSKQVNRDKRLNWWLKRAYNISLDDYKKIFISQNGKCAICGTEENIKRGKYRLNLFVDHCHKTNKIRGLLCQKCNQALGLFKDSTEYLEIAIKYLNK